MVIEVPLSSSMPEPSEEDVSFLDELMSDGKRNYICNEPQVALECFVTLCEKLATFYGQESDKCVEAYLYYGKTLLDIARLENGVLGHAIKEAPVFGSEEDESNENPDNNTEDDEEITAEKRVDIRNHVEHAMRDENLYNDSTEEDTEEETEDEGEKVEETTEETGDEGSKSPESTTTTSTNECSKDKQPAGTVNVESKSAPEDTNAAVLSTAVCAAPNGCMDVDDGIVCDGSEGEDVDAAADAEVSNMELAWEMFELTAFICRRQLEDASFEEKKVKSTLAEAKNGLAQISLETERYDEAINDFKECTELFKDILADKNDRRIAEGHYNIALSLSFDKQYAEAIKEFENAVAILNARVADLETNVKACEAEGTKKKAPAELEEWKKEITELNDIIVLDMMTKIEDAAESKKLVDETRKTIKDAAGELFGALGGTKGEFDAGFDEGFDAPSANTEVIHDCSDKIRSVKRKSDDESSDVVDKKVRTTSIAAPEQ